MVLNIRTVISKVCPRLLNERCKPPQPRIGLAESAWSRKGHSLSNRSLLQISLLLFCLLPVSLNVQAAELRLASKSIIHSFERPTLEDRNADAVPFYEYLQIDYGAADRKGLSLHFYGWGRVAHDEDNFFDDDSRGELIYAYLEYALPSAPTTLKLGRMHIFDGVANESIDGLRVQTDLTSEWSASIYAGLPVSLETTDGRSGDSIFGGRVSWHQMGGHNLGLSYKTLSNDSSQDEELLGLDLSLILPKNLTLLGFLTRNLDSKAWGEQSLELRYAKGPFEIRPQYMRYESEGYFSGQKNLYRAFQAQSQLKKTTQIFGTDAFWFPNESIEVGVKAKYYDYEERFDAAQYLAGLFTYKWKILSQVGFELGRMSGDDAANRYWLTRGFFFFDYRQLFFTADMLYAHYDEPYFEEDGSLFASIGIGWKTLEDRLRIKLSMDYSNDPIFDYDNRYLLVVDYLYDQIQAMK